MVITIDYLLITETITQYAFTIFMAPLFSGIFVKLKARIESRKGPSIFQPYYDIFKYLKKETLRPEGSGAFFLYAPYVTFGIYSMISLIIPSVIPDPIYFTASTDFLGGAILFAFAAFVTIAAAISSNNNYSAMSSSRILSFNFLGEATLITVLFAVSLVTATNNPYSTNHFYAMNPAANAAITHIFSTLAFFMLFLFETGKIPLQTSGLMELGMIEGGVHFEYSGKLLALGKWNGHIKQFLLGSILLNVFIFPWGLYSSFPMFLLDIPVMFLKWMGLILLVLVIETTLARMRLLRILDYLATAFTFSILFLIFSEVIF